MKVSNDIRKIDFFKDLFEKAKLKTTESIESLEKHLKQYKGSSDIDNSNTNADVVRNITYDFIECQISSNLPVSLVSAEKFSMENERNAKSIETLLNALRRRLPFQAMNDIDERYTYIYGGSVWLIEWDESITTHYTVGDVKVSCISPNDFVGQPGMYRVEDMEYCFVSFTTTKEDLVRKYGVSLDIAEDAAESDGDGNEDIAVVTVCYYKDDDGKVCQYVWSDETELLDIDDYYARKRYMCKKCGKREELCSCEHTKRRDYEQISAEYEELNRDIALSNGSILPAMSEKIENGQYVTESVPTIAHDPETNEIIFDETTGIPQAASINVPVYEPTRIPYYRPNRLPIVIRKNTSEERKLFGQSDCEFIRPQQQAINKVESRIMQKLMRSGVTPVVPEDVSISINNSVFGNVIKLKPGQSRNEFGTIDTTPDISRDIIEAERLYDHAKRILGISDSFQGMYDASAQSGKAKQLQINQAAGRLRSKRVMKNHAYSEIDRIIFQYYLAYADEPRPAVFKNALGQLENYEFNRYDFVERDTETGEYYYNDEFIFSAEEGADYDNQREYLWERAIESFRLGTYGDPAKAETLLVYWLNMEKAHYPGAHDNVERISARIQAEQQAAATQQKIADLTKANAVLEEELQSHANYENFILENIGDDQ